MDFNLSHLGAHDSVTGSCHLLQHDGLSILVDCGLSMGDDPTRPFEGWPVPPSEIDYLFLTHAHIDHIGRIPDLIEAGFAGEILCSHPTKALLLPMLHDAMAFSHRAADEVTRLETAIDELSWGFEYQESFALKQGVRFKLGRAGHILGSSFILFTLSSGDATPYRILFSGDLGCKGSPILCDPDPPDACDLLILESTYGDRNHEDRSERVERLERVLTRALKDGGKVFIPAFSLGRTQELIFEIDRIRAKSTDAAATEAEQGRAIHEVPVFVDSPLGLEITRIYSSLAGFWDQESQALLKEGDHPIDFKHLVAVRSYQDHQKALTFPGPAIVIAGSGMCTGGRIVDHLADGLADSKNDVLFVGYQAKGTLGRDILTHGPRENGYARINGEKVFINAKVHKLGGYSAHADQKELVEWVAAMPERPGRIRLVHGEREAQSELREVLSSKGYRVDGSTDHGDKR